MTCQCHILHSSLHHLCDRRRDSAAIAKSLVLGMFLIKGGSNVSVSLHLITNLHVFNPSRGTRKLRRGKPSSRILALASMTVLTASMQSASWDEEISARIMFSG